MNQAELIEDIAQNTGFTKSNVKTMLAAQEDAVFRALYKGENDVTLPGIGKLKVVTRAARTGRNPGTGEDIEIPEKRAVKLTVAKSLTEAVA